MKRIALALALFAPLLSACSKPAKYDVVIRHGTVYDGTGAPGRTADVAILDDRIAARRRSRRAERGREEVDATGLAVAPGFINMLSHSETSLIDDGRSQGTLRQGVTLEVFGESSMGPLTEQMKTRPDGAPGRHQVRHRLDHARRLSRSPRRARRLDQRGVVRQRGDRPRERDRPRQSRRRPPRSSTGCARHVRRRWTRARWG